MTKKRTEQTAVQQWNEEKKWVNECEIGKVRIEKWKLNEKKKVGFGEEEYVVVVVGREFAFLSGLGRKVGIRNLRRRRGGGGGAEVNGVLHRAWECFSLSLFGLFLSLKMNEAKERVKKRRRW